MARVGEAGGSENLLGRFQRLALGIAGEALFSQAMEPFTEALRASLERYGARYARPSPLDFVLKPTTRTPLLMLRRRVGAEYSRLIERIIAKRREQVLNELKKQKEDLKSMQPPAPARR